MVSCGCTPQTRGRRVQMETCIDVMDETLSKQYICTYVCINGKKQAHLHTKNGLFTSRWNDRPVRLEILHSQKTETYTM